MPSEVVLVQGSTLAISDIEVTDIAITPLPTMHQIECIGRELTWQGGQSAEIDTTTFCSTAKEFELGLEDSGTLTLNGHWVQTNAAHVEIREASTDKLRRLIIVTFPDASEFRALALVQSRSWSMSVDGVVTATYVFRVTGATQETP